MVKQDQQMEELEEQNKGLERENDLLRSKVGGGALISWRSRTRGWRGRNSDLLRSKVGTGLLPWGGAKRGVSHYPCSHPATGPGSGTAFSYNGCSPEGRLGKVGTSVTA